MADALACLKFRFVSSPLTTQSDAELGAKEARANDEKKGAMAIVTSGGLAETDTPMQ
jgi:hypothetical protein